MISTIIIDDEKDSMDGLVFMLTKHCPDIRIVATANSAAEGIQKITEFNPELIFLDVEMPHGSGFEVLKHFPVKNFKTIFITAYNHYAIKAIKFSALDYLLKPIDVDDLCNAVEKARNQSLNSVREQHGVLLDNLSPEKPQKLAIPVKDGFLYTPIRQIVRLEGDGSYCTFHLEDGKKIMVTQNLGVYEELLVKNKFFRTHQSHLVNLIHVSRFSKTDGGTVIMSDNSVVPVSRRNKEGLYKMVLFPR